MDIPKIAEGLIADSYLLISLRLPTEIVASTWPHHKEQTPSFPGIQSVL